jgi:hypothetical protein
MNKSRDQFPKEEAQERFTAALKGARLAGHRPMESLRAKPKKQRKPKKKASGKLPD